MTALMTAELRPGVEGLLMQAEHLSPPDRSVIRGVYELGLTAAAWAKANGQPAKQVRKRLQRVMSRIKSREFQFVLRHKNDWPDTRRAIAEAVILRGQSQRVTAACLHMTVYQVRLELERIRAMCAA